jgi:threonylcarbamoyladenosine tRNA methylthiotransferase MtaB
MRIHLAALGCRLNEAELETWQRQFESRGHRITNDPSNCDLVVLNTCAVTGEAARKSRKLLRRAHRQNPLAKLVVSGCYSSLHPEQVQELEGVDLVVPNERKDQLVEETERHLHLASMPRAAMDETILHLPSRQRAFIKVQDGCRYQCTFCIVTRARGEERSRTPGEILEEIRLLHAGGVEEIVLTGVHLGGYGSDGQSSLDRLLRLVLDETDVPRIRLGALEPWDLSDAFWQLFEDPRMQPHLHLPLQSGCDQTLKRMARRCKTREFESMVRAARERYPGFNVTTDVIVGFPGEDEQEWAESRDFIAALEFGHLHIFAFSPRSGTRAASLPEPVDPSTIRQRSNELHLLGDRMKRKILNEQLGDRVQVLVERQQNDSGTLWNGYTPNFHRVSVEVPTAAAQAGKCLTARLCSVNDKGDTLLALAETSN